MTLVYTITGIVIATLWVAMTMVVIGKIWERPVFSYKNSFRIALLWTGGTALLGLVVGALAKVTNDAVFGGHMQGLVIAFFPFLFLIGSISLLLFLLTRYTDLTHKEVVATATADVFANMLVTILLAFLGF